MHESRAKFAQLIREFRRCTRPIVAQVQGHVAGGGMGLVAACDLAVASDDVTFSTPEIRVGLFPMMIMTLLNRTIPRKNLLEMMLTGEKISAQRAVDLGFINHAVPRESLPTTATQLAAKVASFSPAVLKLGREAFHRMEDMPMDDALDYLCAQLSLNTLTEDAAEGMMAFMMKRAPEWKGR
jgi:enoyl-CoA hydratase/carnithine racemase